jgi:hypothetical protein
VKQSIGFSTILGNSLPVVIHVPETVLSLRYPLLCGFAIPTSGFNTILQDAVSIIKAQAQSILSFCVALVGGLVVPVESFQKVLRYALPYVIHVTKGVLGFHIALICRFSIPFEGFTVVLRYALAVVIHQSKCVLRNGVSLLGSNMASLCIRHKSLLNPSIVGLPDERYSTGSNDASDRNNDAPRQSQFATLPVIRFPISINLAWF